jgi:hypothetical protein
MNYDFEKECNRMFWIVKGHLIPRAWHPEDIVAMYNSYFERMWGNHEACYHEEGFEEAWAKRKEEDETLRN